MTQFIRVYLDLETYDIKPTASVWQIGLVAKFFNDSCDSKVFYQQSFLDPRGLNYDPKPRLPGTVSKSTIDWLIKTHEAKNNYSTECDDIYWTNKFGKKAAIPAVKTRKDEPYHLALISNITSVLNQAQRIFCPKVNLSNRELVTVYTWGNFDFPIWEHMLSHTNVENPFHHGSSCSLRDVAKFHNIPRSLGPDTSTHSAGADAEALCSYHEELIKLGYTKLVS